MPRRSWSGGWRPGRGRPGTDHAALRGDGGATQFVGASPARCRPQQRGYQRYAAAGSAAGHVGHSGRAGRVLPTCHRYRERCHSRDHPEPSARPAALESRSTRRSPWPASVRRLIGNRVDPACHRPPNGLQGRGPGARLCRHPSGCRYGCGRCLPLRPGDTPARRQDSRVRARRCAGHDRGNLDLHAAYLAQVGIADPPGAATCTPHDWLVSALSARLYSLSALKCRYTDARLTPSARAISVGLSPRARRARAAASLSASITVGRPPLRP